MKFFVDKKNLNLNELYFLAGKKSFMKILNKLAFSKKKYLRASHLKS